MPGHADASIWLLSALGILCARGGPLQERADAEAEERRAATELPERAEALVDFFLECEAADMEFWVARARARLGAPFFAAVDTALGEARLLGEGGEERVAELEGLRAYVNQTLAAQDSVKKGAPARAEHTMQKPFA